MPSFLSGKKLILLGFVIVLLIAIPLTVYLVQQQQKTKSSAVAATTVSFVPSTKTVNVGDNFSLDIKVDPGGINQISFARVNILYDATKLATSGAGVVIDSWKASDGTNFTPSVLQGPVYGPGSISFTISVGSSPQNVIQQPTVIATANFQAVSPTDTAPTQITFSNQTQVLSLGATDQFNENVLSSAPPANITINSVAVTPTLTPTPTQTPVSTGTPTPTPTQATTLSCSLSSDTTSVAPSGVANLTTSCTESTGTFDTTTATYTWSATCGTVPSANTSTNTWTAPSTTGSCTVSVNVCDQAGNCSQPSVGISVGTSSTTPTPTPIATTAQLPVCSSLVLGGSTTGTAPYTVNLTATGSSSNSTISVVTFNFGDGQTQNITQSGGIGSNSVSVLQSHVYSQAGTYNATATLTDANGNVSVVGSCTQTITVTSTVASGPTPLPSPLPPTGPSNIVTVGAIGVVLTIVGAILLFAL